MKIQTERHDPTRLLALEGELDPEGSAELEERCLYEQQEGGLHFVIDLGGITRITGPGLRVLLGLARTLPRAGGSLVLCTVEARIREALLVSGLEGSFELAPDRPSALARSLELQSTRSRLRPVSREEAKEKIDFAIELLGSTEPQK